MEIIPAIDIRGGRVVRLYQGDFRRETVYSDDPLAVAVRWREAGAPRIHVVDLDGAVAGCLVNAETVQAIAAGVDVPLQVGGGVRDVKTAERLRGMGVERVVFGTAAISDPEVVAQAREKIGAEGVVVAVDARSGRVAIQGWQKTASMSAGDLVKAMAATGVKRFIYTDVDLDGTLEGPNIQAVAALMKAVNVPIICSGGIRSMEDLERLAEVGVEGAIVGSALYRGDIDLFEAVKRFGG
ncbi:MAG: 1-(5-phosphoribosyl)-5-[(5-phosphoribosylamino)methylideneamino]imidazole-4-carboxamide isomerase [Chloroflexi bacterium]|nr:1-(5-phosphoribosyl)-5-[(5-phosphoribosylamino)methylideneamino]imidazole-4-carboxamide isomerase [Chloroflexota bacterium]